MSRWSAAVSASLGLVIRQRREALGLSQAEVARRVLTPRPLVSRVESRRHVVTLETLERYAHALECKPSELLAAAEALVAAVPSDAERVYAETMAARQRANHAVLGDEVL